ncbi:MAG: SCO1664 family protein [Actinomycetota bacterium]|nr:SCO1664 family protein [Actinomycetota bacterium]
MSGDERALETDLSAGRPDLPIPEALLSGELEILGLMPNSSNYTFLARASNGEEPDVLAIYKPQRGETPLWDFPEGTLCRREVAAYEVSRALGWPNVPPTVLREGPEGIGSVQLFVDFDPDHHYFTLEDAHPDEFRRIALFDLVVNNADRKGGHCLLGRDGRIWVIDHGVCFSDEPKLRTVIWGFVGEPIPAAELEGLREAAISLEEGGALQLVLAALLAPEETEALRERLDTLVEAGAFPEPGPGRPYPWPPI